MFGFVRYGLNSDLYNKLNCNDNMEIGMDFTDDRNIPYLYHEGELFGALLTSYTKNQVYIGKLDGISTYPTSAGLYRLTGKFKDKLPSSCSYYGVLVVFSTEYCLHFLADTNGNFYIAYSGSIGSISSSSWKRITVS